MNGYLYHSVSGMRKPLTCMEQVIDRRGTFIV